MECAAQHPLRIEQHGDDPHRLLRVIAAMSQRIERCGHQLQLAEHPVRPLRREAAEDPADEQHQHQRQEQPDGRRQDDGDAGLEHAAPHHGGQPRLGQARAQQPADQGVAGRGWDAQPPGDEVPRYRPHQRAEDQLRVDDAGVDDPLAHRGRDMQPEEEESDEVEEGGPGDRIVRLENASRHDRRDRVGGVVQAVQEIEQQGDADQRDQQGQGDGFHDGRFRRGR